MMQSLAAIGFIWVAFELAPAVMTVVLLAWLALAAAGGVVHGIRRSRRARPQALHPAMDETRH